MGFLRKLKDKYYYKLVEKNPAIRDTYQMYVDNNQELHASKKFGSWRYLLRLNRAAKKNQNLSNVPLPKSAANVKQKSTPSQNKPATASPSANLQKKTVKLPYLEGSESNISRVSPASFAWSFMEKCDVVSFDVFDTIIFRPFNDPKALFEILGEKFKIFNFSLLRQECEKNARALNMANSGSPEVTIYDIYKLINVQTGIDINYGVSVEFETELELCYANPYMQHIFKILKSRGKKIIAISDMYLTHDMVKAMINKCGFYPDELFVSSEYHVSKRSGMLYKIVQAKHPRNTEFFHIGDNYQTDCVNARKVGWQSIHFKNNHDIGNIYRADGMSGLVGSAYAGIVNNELHNGTKKYNPYFEYGFIYGGLYILGYINFIHNYCIKNNIEKILFLARDGSIYMRAYQKIFGADCFPHEYVLWSTRIATAKYLAKHERYDFFLRMVHHRAANPILTNTISSLLKALHLNELESDLHNNRLTPETIVCPETEKRIVQFFVDNWDKVIAVYHKEELQMRDILQRVIGDSKNVVVVDVGWQGSGPLGIKKLIEHEWQMDCKVHCMIAASNATCTQQMTEEVIPYLFSYKHNRNNFDAHMCTNKNLNSIFFEIFTQDTAPSFSVVGSSGELLYDLLEIENYEVITDVHQGVLHFIELYCKHFNNYTYMLNISGYDACLPFRMLIRDLGYIRNTFSTYSCSRNVGCDMDNQQVETIGQIIDAQKLF